jgi:hypothetical protein
LEQAVEIDRDRFTRRLDLGPYLWWAVLVLVLVQVLLSILLLRRRGADWEAAEDEVLNAV